VIHPALTNSNFNGADGSRSCVMDLAALPQSLLQLHDGSVPATLETQTKGLILESH